MAVFAAVMTTKGRPPGTSKVRRDVVGGKRGDGHRRDRVRRPDPTRIRIRSTREKLTGCAGLAAFGSFTRREGIEAMFRRHFDRLKPSERVVYPMSAQMRLLMDAHAVGETRVFGVEALAADPLFVRMAGGSVPDIATLYRDLARFDASAVEQLDELVAQQGLHPSLGLQRHARVHLDIDTTVWPLFGSHQGAAIGHNPHYHRRPSYHPITCRIAETDTCAGAQLRSGDTAFGAEDAPKVRALVERARRALRPRQMLVVRIDAAGDCSELLQTLHELHSQNVRYVIKARVTGDMRSAVTATTSWTATDWDADDEPIVEVAEIAFAREQWKQRDLPVRLVAQRTTEPTSGRQLYLWDELEWTTKLYLTNLDDAVDDVVQCYEHRAGIEPLIAEWKNGWGLADAPVWAMLGNEAAMLLKLLTHNLIRRFVRRVAPAIARWRIHWLRRALLAIPGKLVRTGRQWRLLVPALSMLTRLRE